MQGAALGLHLASDFSALVDVGVDARVVGTGADGVPGLGIQNDDVCIRPRCKRALPWKHIEGLRDCCARRPDKG